MNTGWSWVFLLAVFAGLCFLAMIIGVMVLLFRAATRASGRPPGETRRGESGNAVFPTVVGADVLTNPANPLYHLYHPSPMPDDSTRHHGIDPAPSSPPTFDAGSSSSPSVDTGGAGCG